MMLYMDSKQYGCIRANLLLGCRDLPTYFSSSSLRVFLIVSLLLLLSNAPDTVLRPQNSNLSNLPTYE